MRHTGHMKALWSLILILSYNIQSVFIMLAERPLCASLCDKESCKGNNNNNNNGEFLYSAHTMLCALHTYYPWSLDLFIHVPFQLPFGAYSTCSHFGARN